MSELPPEPDPNDRLNRPGEPPDLEEILRRSQGITPDTDQAVEFLAALHARWRRAWRDTGEFSDDESFELARILVAVSAGGLRQLGLQCRSRLAWP